MDLDIGSVVVFILVVVLVVYLLRKFFHIVGSIFIAFIVLFVALFMLKDVLHVPVNDYVDVSDMDRLKVEGYGYIEDKIDKYKGEYYEMGGEDGSEKHDGVNEEGDVDVYVDEVVGERDVESIDYVDMNDEVLDDFIRIMEGRVEDSRFREKLTGMSKHVDIVYDLGNAKMRNSKDKKSVEVVFK